MSPPADARPPTPRPAVSPAETLRAALAAERDPVRRAALVADARAGWEEAEARAAGRGRALQALRDATTALGRAFDETEVVQELGRHASRLPAAASAMVALPTAADAAELAVVLRLSAGDDWPAPPAPMDDAERAAVAEVVREGRAVIADDGRLLAAPLLHGIQMQGAVVVRAAGGADGATFGPDDGEFLRTLGAQAAAALEHARLYAESERERRQSEALAEVARAVGESLRLADVLRLSLRHAEALLRAEGALVALRTGDYLEVVAGSGRGDVLQGMFVPEEASLLGEVLRSGESRIVNDVLAQPQIFRPAQRASQAQRMVVAPLVAAGGAIGTLVVINRATPFDDADARVLQRLAAHVAVAIMNARLYEEVVESTREWTVAFDAIATGMVLLDAGGRVARANARAAQLAGAEGPRALVGRPFPGVLGPGVDAEGASLVERALAERVTVRGSLRAGTPGRLFQLVASPHPFGGLVVTFDDVTTLQALSERYRRVVETTRDAIVITDLDRRIAYANPAAEALFAREGGVVGAPVEALVPMELRPQVERRERAALAGEPQRYESYVQRADGSRRLVSISTAPLSELGQVTGVVAALRDVTDERAGARALAHSEARYARLVEAAPDAIFTTDAAGVLTSANPSLGYVLGIPVSRLVGRHVTELVAPAERGMVRELLAGTLAGQRLRAEIPYPGERGQRNVGSVITAPIVEEGRVTGTLALVRDVTEERVLAAQLLQQEKLAAVGQLVSGVAHELNNPLAGIMAFSQLLLSSHGADGEQRQAAATIEAEARRAARIVANLLTFARQQEPARTAVALNDVVRAVAELRRYTLRVQQVAVRLELDPTLSPTWADESQLRQVVLNLVSNAEQALRDWDGERTLTLRTWQEEERLFVQVADTGPGVAPEQLDRIFNPFFTTKPVGQGTGLGLSISHGIVREHGGRITAESSPGAGATFTVELPLVAPPTNEAALARARRAEADEEPGVERRAARVLVVDDEPTIRRAVVRFLAREGFATDAVPGGREALRRLETSDYDAILLDLRMPDVSGDAVYEALRARDPVQAGRVVFVTGDLLADRTRAFLERSGCPVVRKPFVFDELLRVLRDRLPADDVEGPS